MNDPMVLAGYTLLVSFAYFVLYWLAPATAESLTVLFIAFLLVPACYHRAKKRRDRRS